MIYTYFSDTMEKQVNLDFLYRDSDEYFYGRLSRWQCSVQVHDISVVSFDYGRTAPTRFLFSARIGLRVLLNSATSYR